GPERFVEVPFADRARAPVDEDRQEVERFGGELDSLAVAQEEPAIGVKNEGAERQHCDVRRLYEVDQKSFMTARPEASILGSTQIRKKGERHASSHSCIAGCCIHSQCLRGSRPISAARFRIDVRHSEYSCRRSAI